FGDKYKNLELLYSVEKEPLGTGGAVKLAFQKVVTPHAMVLNGDTLFRINLDLFFQKHIETLAKVSLALRHVDDASRYGAVECSAEHNITGFKEKSAIASPGLINGGNYIIKSKYFSGLDLPEKFSLENDFFSKKLEPKWFIGHIFDDYFLDIGIPDDYNRAQNEFNAFKDR
ncbi:MAG: D-glycero-D-manno-heptose 1-phosphate guanosyltransferase, partial [Lentimicrobium sp.]|nr:D-glycero-D-manno-heptose 1-phosphate guanosyltransferase [Lentimicrobium sp.]